MIEEFRKYFTELHQFLIEKAPAFIVGLVILLVFIFLGYVIRRFIRQRLINKLDDVLLTNFIGRIVFLIFLVIGIVLFLNQLGLGKAAGGLLAGAGVSAIIVGFAFKDIGENFLAGFFLAFSRPFSIGDILEIEGIKGTVKALYFRNTHIRTFDGKDVYMPNAMLIKNPLINYSRDGLQRFDFVVGLDYGDDILAAIKVINESLTAIKDIEQEGILKPFIMLDELSTSTVNLRIYYWINSLRYTGDIAWLKTVVMNAVLVDLKSGEFNMPADIVELKIYQEGQPIPVKITETKILPDDPK